MQLVICHSLGGLMTLQALQDAPDLPVRRVVCLGSPLCGSAAARGLAQRGGRWAMGRSAAILQQGFARWDGQAEIGQVAGNVALAETRLPGLRDHCVVRASHSGLLRSPEAAAQALAFLRTGRFQA
ncbi:conserved hypothetical protein [Xanthomonas citri pv. bilvae]|nr:conserved hypothetical protein [Xanthomonas citri pv. bilvae]